MTSLPTSFRSRNHVATMVIWTSHYDVDKTFQIIDTSTLYRRLFVTSKRPKPDVITTCQQRRIVCWDVVTIVQVLDQFENLLNFVCYSRLLNNLRSTFIFLPMLKDTQPYFIIVFLYFGKLHTDWSHYVLCVLAPE